MGRVFGWEALRDKQVPRLESFDAVGRILRKELEASPVIVSALILGSFLRRDHGARSDIDVFVLYPLDQRAEAIALLSDLRARASRFYVPVEFISLESIGRIVS